MDSFYSEEELANLGIASIGKNVLISRKASIYGGDNIQIGNNVRIDDFCILSGKIQLGSFIHISAYTSLFGGKEKGIVMEDYTTVSSRCVIYALSDDYSGEYMTNAVIPKEFTNVIEDKVEIRKYAIVGTGCTVLPGVVIGEGAAVGAMSLVNKDLDGWIIYAGIPCKKLKPRSTKLLDVVTKFAEKCREN